MTRILFVCLGNQCRSPMAEYILKEMLHRKGLGEHYYVESAGTLSGIIGRPVYIPAKAELQKHGISCNDHYARQLAYKDYTHFDYIVCMDKENIISVERIVGGDTNSKICLLYEFPRKEGHEILDPMITDDYDTAYQEIEIGCEKLLSYLEEEGARI